jgi:hypothetical protein
MLDFHEVDDLGQEDVVELREFNLGKEVTLQVSKSVEFNPSNALQDDHTACRISNVKTRRGSKRT